MVWYRSWEFNKPRADKFKINIKTRPYFTHYIMRDMLQIDMKIINFPFPFKGNAPIFSIIFPLILQLPHLSVNQPPHFHSTASDWHVEARPRTCGLRRHCFMEKIWQVDLANWIIVYFKSLGEQCCKWPQVTSHASTCQSQKMWKGWPVCWKIFSSFARPRHNT